MTQRKERENRQPQSHEFEEIVEASAPPSQNLSFADLSRVKVFLTAELGSRSMFVRDILELKRGVVLPLNKPAGEMVDLYVNGKRLAKGEVMVFGDALTVRIGEIVTEGEPSSGGPLGG